MARVSPALVFANRDRSKAQSLAIARPAAAPAPASAGRPAEGGPWGMMKYVAALPKVKPASIMKMSRRPSAPRVREITSFAGDARGHPADRPASEAARA